MLRGALRKMTLNNYWQICAHLNSLKHLTDIVFEFPEIYYTEFGYFYWKRVALEFLRILTSSKLKLKDIG